MIEVDTNTRSQINSPGEGMDMEEKEISTETTETREQILEVINFYLPTLTERQLRMVRGFIRGLKRDKKRE